MSPQSGQVSRRPGFTLAASQVAVVHTYLAFAAFFSALVIGCLLHYKKIVKNGVAGYPQEWFPSVSATIGDWYPERNIFQILIAINSGPRFALTFLQYYLQRSTNTVLPGALLFIGVSRTLSCGGWVYITSSDNHDWHDILMITYIVCNLPWMFGGIAATPRQNSSALKRRKAIAYTFFLSIIPMVYFFIQHKVHRVPGAYTRYSFFEWGLIILDVLYDSVISLDFEAANLHITIGVNGGAETQDITIIKEKVVISEQITTTAIVGADTAQELKPTSAATVAKQETPFSVTHALLNHAGPTLSFISDVYLSFISWSVFTALTITLFYFSVWELAIAGSEFALLATLSPILLGIPGLLSVFASRGGRAILYGITITFGLFAYTSPKPIHRLVLTAFANVALCMGWAVDWSAPAASVQYQGIVTGLGLFMLSLSKHANYSNSPVWPIVNSTAGGYNKTGILLAVLALHNFCTRKENDISHEAPATTLSKDREISSPTPVRTQWYLDALALGTLIFNLHSFLTDSSTLIAWSWTGYPIKGPVPHLHGSLTHIAQAIGLLLPLVTQNPDTSFLSHPLWLVYGGFSAYVLYSYENWAGYIGGFTLAIFLSSIIPNVLQRSASSGHVGKTYSLAMLFVTVFYVTNTFTVAYAFVPGGEYFRERTDIVLGAQILCIAPAFRWSRSTPTSSVPSLPKTIKVKVKNTLAFLSILSLLATMYHWPTIAPRPHRPGPRILRAGIWTMHFGMDNEGRDSQRRMRDLIGDMELDVVGLLETDLHRVVYGNRDLTRVLVEDLGYYVDLGPGPNRHTWGAVLLSKFPIINSTHHLLPSPDGELAPAIHAVLDVFGTAINVIVAHNGQEETPLDRELQSTELARIMSSVYPEPVIFLGYVVTKPHASRPAPYDIMVNDGRVHDIDKDDLDRWCEYILFRGLYRTSYARVSRSTITDTELQIGEFLLPKHGHGVTNETEPARYLRAWKEELPKDHWFPMEYYPASGGLRGHYYHVFGTPLYYKIPEGAIL